MKELTLLSFKTKGQIEDSGLGVRSNIAEASCRRHMKEAIQYNSIALACMGENYSQIFALLKSDEYVVREIVQYHDSLPTGG